MENVLNINYNTKLDKPKIKKIKVWKNIIEFIKKHKIITIIFTGFISLSIINFCLIFNFIKVIENL